MILVALGANLPSRYGGPEDTLLKAVEALEAKGLRVCARSSIWRSAPVPVSDQPWYCNAVVSVETALKPAALMALLHEIEQDFGRVRSVRNAPRCLDLDLVAYHDEVSTAPELMIPHPRLHERAFVLQPLQEIAPDWTHPVLKLSVLEMVEHLPSGQVIEKAQPQKAFAK